MNNALGKGVAEDPEVNRICRAFLKAKRFDQLDGYEHLRNQVLTENGITDPDLIYNLESVWIDYRQYQQELRKQHDGNKRQRHKT